jgi:flavin-binding protein dodecin
MSDHVYKHIELTGSSKTSIEDAIKVALSRASQTLRGMHWFEVTDTRGYLEGGNVAYWQVTIKVGFTLEDSGADTAAGNSPPGGRVAR